MFLMDAAQCNSTDREERWKKVQSVGGCCSRLAARAACTRRTRAGAPATVQRFRESPSNSKCRIPHSWTRQHHFTTGASSTRRPSWLHGSVLAGCNSAQLRFRICLGMLSKVLERGVWFIYWLWRCSIARPASPACFCCLHEPKPPPVPILELFLPRMGLNGGVLGHASSAEVARR
jgi:hypothetical protein